MRALAPDLRRKLESAVLEGRRAAEAGVRAALLALGVQQERKPVHLNEGQAQLRRGLRAKQRQLGGEVDGLVWECAYEQWHGLLFARFLAESGLLRHPGFDAPVTLAECEELAEDLGEPDGWSVAARFAAEILPGIFRLDDPCVQMRLAPEHRVRLERIVAGLPGEVFAADDSLGWVYQYWQKERKDQVNASEVKIGGNELGPVTQLFTENYMVRFLLENSLGAWWAARYPDSPLLKRFGYLRFDDDGQPAAGVFEGWPETAAEISVMDPCCGSGHFLVEAFGMLWPMRAEEEGLDPVAAQDAVLRDNLFGLELDPRCVQIAMFLVALTAWKQGGGWRRLPMPNIACSGIPVRAPLEEWTALADGDERLERGLKRLHNLFQDAETLGSLIDPRRASEFANASGVQRSFDDVSFEEIAPLLEKAAARETDDPAAVVLGADATAIARAAALLSRAYTLVATNVPYLLRRKQTRVLAGHLERHFSEGAGDLATGFVGRFSALAAEGGVSGVVLPNNWTNATSFEELRRSLLSRSSWLLVARLGAGAFDSISGEVVSVVLWLVRWKRPPASTRLGVIDVSSANSPARKAESLAKSKILYSLQKDHLGTPQARIVARPFGDRPLLSSYAHAYKGLTTGDDGRWKRRFWELDQTRLKRWDLLQTSFSDSSLVDGCHYCIDFAGMTTPLQHGVELRGENTWGKIGVAVSQMSLAASLSAGAKFDQNVAVVMPANGQDLPAILAFCQSPEYPALVRTIDQSLKVTNATLTQVPFDIDEWRKVAKEELPSGLAVLRSNDPTQWLFAGRPEVSTEPLQVAVARLLGVQWPEQHKSDGLDELVDDDGIVCLPAVGGELQAAERLHALLRDAYGSEHSRMPIRQMLRRAGSRKDNLADWLRDDFFKHHCKVFSNRPFVWHIWDGRKDGFSAIVNYHRLDRAGLGRLTYTYLGDWIERQKADAAEEVSGADIRLAAARELTSKLEAILEGEPPYDIYVRWKALHEQPIGWDPDLDDGVRLNIRPFVEAGVLRSKVNVRWKKDRGKNPDGSERLNDLHYTRAEKQRPRQKAGDA